MEKKDYLKELAAEAEEKPESFREERVEYMQKEPFDYRKLLAAIAVLVIAAVAVYFLFLAPKIEMPDFVGQSKTDISNWVRQEKIETSGIVIREEYNFDNEEDTVIAQDVPAGTRVKDDVTVTFVVSKGADPDELIDFPDLKNMDSEEISEWVAENKLSRVDISTLYSNTVPEGEVISYEITQASEVDFTRSSRLNVVVSKGVAPAKTISLEDLVGQTRAYVEAYAAQNKLDITYVEVYDEDVMEGMVIAQSVAKNTDIKEGDSLTVTVSKGQVVLMKNLVGMTREEAGLWLSNNQVSSNFGQESTLRYTNEHNAGTIISQSIKAGSVIGDEDYLFVTESKGMLDLHDFAGAVYVSGTRSLVELQNWVYEQNHNGDAQMGSPLVTYVDESTDCAAGQICRFDTAIDYLKVGTLIRVEVAAESADNKLVLTPEDLDSGAALVAFCERNSIGYTREWKTMAGEADGSIFSVQVNDDTIYDNNVVKLGTADGGLSGYELSTDDVINIIIVQN